MALRIWLLSRALKIGGIGVGLALLVWIGIFAYAHWSVIAFSLTVGALLTTAISVVLGTTGWGLLSNTIQYRKTFQSILIGIGMGTAGWMLARLHLHVFDRIFLRQGSLAALLEESETIRMRGRQ